MKGVLWSGDQVFEGTVDVLDRLRGHGKDRKVHDPFAYLNERYLGKQIIFVTNNSTKSRTDYVQKLQSLGISAAKVGLLLPHSIISPISVW